MKFRKCLVVLIAAVSMLLSACTTSDTSKKKTEVAQSDEEYELVYPVGSRIPVRVKKARSDSTTTADEKNKDTIRTHQDLKNAERFPTDR